MVAVASGVRARRRGFSVWFMIAIAVIVIFGFSHSVPDALIHPRKPAPPILYIHLAVCLSWLGLSIAQAGFVRAGDIRRHRQIGLWGLCLGALVVLVSLTTVFVMRERAIADHPGDPFEIAFLAIPLSSFLMFAAPFTLAALWRKRPERHRPLMMLAACGLTPAAMARIPWLTGPSIPLIYAGLMLAAAADETLRVRRLSLVYLIGIPALLAESMFAVVLITLAPPAWMSLARFLLGVQHP